MRTGLRKLVGILVVALLFVRMSAEVQGGLLAYEGFDTTDAPLDAEDADGENLPTFEGSGFGWGDQWRWNANTGNGISIDSPGLSHGTLLTAGKLATSNYDGSSAGHYRRELSQSYTIGSGAGEKGEIWVSWLTTWTPGVKALQWLNLNNNETLVDGAGINNWGNVQGTELQDQWRLNHGTYSDPGNNFSGVVAQSGEVYQLAMRLFEDFDDTLVELYVNSGGDRQLGSALASRTIPGAVTFDQIRLHATSTATTAEWDEIRIGDTYEDVGLIAIPEPASIGLLGLASLVILLQRRLRARKE